MKTYTFRPVPDTFTLTLPDDADEAAIMRAGYRELENIAGSNDGTEMLANARLVVEHVGNAAPGEDGDE
jgi:hypothetical protein